MKGNKEARKEHDEDEGALLNSVEFKIHCMKVLPCSKRFCHDWTVCPFAHPGEKARRRDPRLFTYTGIACPDMKKDQSCLRGDACPYAHNVFEYWLHPTRYRTQLCNDGPSCTRRICFFAHSLEELRVPANKPFVPPEALAAASVSAALKAAEKAAAASNEAPSPAKAGRSGGKEEGAAGAANSAELARQLAALQVAASTPSGSRTAQEERRVVEVLSALLKTYEAAPEGAPGGSSPSRRASADLPAHSRSLQQRGGNGNGANGAGSADDRLPILSGARNNSDPAHRGRGGGRTRSSNAQTRRSLDYGMQRALMAHTVDESALFLQPMAEGSLLGVGASQSMPAFSPAELASAWAAANAAQASSGAAASPPGTSAARDWAPAPDFHQGAGAPEDLNLNPNPGQTPPPPSAGELLAQLARLQQAQTLERALSAGAAAGGRRNGRRGGGGGPAAQAALQAHLALLNQHAAAQQAAQQHQQAVALQAQQQNAMQQQAAMQQAAVMHQHQHAAAAATAAARGGGGRGDGGVAIPFAGPALAESSVGGGLAWPWEQIEGVDMGNRRQSVDSSRLSVDTSYRMSGDYARGADLSERASFESMQGVASHDLGDFARTFDASQRYSVESMRSATPPASAGAYGSNYGSLFAFSGPYGHTEQLAAELNNGAWGGAPADAVGGANNPDPNPVSG